MSQENITLDRATYFSDLDGAGPLPATCDPSIAGRFLCDAIGKRLTSSLGYTLLYDDRDNRIRPTRGQSIGISQDFAGLGGNVKYIKTRLNADKFWRIGRSSFIFSVAGEGGYIHPLENRGLPFVDDVRLTDRFYLGEPQMRGFDIRGVGPRVTRFNSITLTDTKNPIIVRDAPRNNGEITDDAIGGRAYYLVRGELQIPLGTGAKELGLRPSVFVDIGSVFNVTQPGLTKLDNFKDAIDGNFKNRCITPTGTVFATQTAAAGEFNTCPTTTTRNIRPYQEEFFGDTWKPRLSIGVGVNWNSPFGPFRIDIARALLKEPGDDTKLFTFNVGTQF